MPDPPPSGRSKRRFERAFILRVWREAGGTGNGSLRVSLVELGDGRRFFFTHLEDLVDFVKLTVEEGE